MISGQLAGEGEGVMGAGPEMHAGSAIIIRGGGEPMVADELMDVSNDIRVAAPVPKVFEPHTQSHCLPVLSCWCSRRGKVTHTHTNHLVTYCAHTSLDPPTAGAADLPLGLALHPTCHYALQKTNTVITNAATCN